MTILQGLTIQMLVQKQINSVLIYKYPLSNQIIKTIERLQQHQWLTAWNSVRATFFIFPQTHITFHWTVLRSLCKWMMTFCFFLTSVWLRPFLLLRWCFSQGNWAQFWMNDKNAEGVTHWCWFRKMVATKLRISSSKCNLLPKLLST